jgi:hypothetical protein
MEGVGTMNPTHEPDTNTALSRAFGVNFLADLLTSRDRFAAWIATATSTATHPVTALAETDGAGYDLTDAGRAALTKPDLTSVTASTCPVDLVTETDDEATTRVLCSAATYLERYGWIQGAYYDATSQTFTPAACMVGAIAMVCYGGPVDAPAQHFDDPGFLDFEAAVLHLDRYLLAEDGSESYEFNDAKDRRSEDITHVLRDAASRPAHELIDALRVIDRRNADMAALSAMLIPGGIFAHVDYPHTPGTLYDCPACEATCFCTDGFQCVRCALDAEQDSDGGDLA